MAAVLSGCVSNEDTQKLASPASGPAQADDQTGGIEGLVTDDQFIPIEGATVQVNPRGLTATTDKAGRFAFSFLDPGNVEVHVTIDGYHAAARDILVQADQVSRLDLQLIALPSADAFHVLQTKPGKIFCGIAVKPVTGFAACGAVYDTPLSHLDTFVVIFDLTATDIDHIEGILFETQWEPTQIFGKGLDVLWENYQELIAYTFTEPVRRFARVQGQSPLIAYTDRQGIDDNVTGHDPPPEYCHDGSTCRIWARVFPYASTLGESYAADLALYYDQRYDHYVTEFYGAPAPTDYSALPDQ